MELKQSIHEYLKVNCFGRGTAAKAEYLANGFNVSLRDVNEAVRQLRKDGYLVGSSKEKPYGYYLPANESEISGYLGTFKSELFDMLKTFNRQKRARKA
jgi:biotin operon repressor